MTTTTVETLAQALADAEHDRDWLTAEYEAHYDPDLELLEAKEQATGRATGLAHAIILARRALDYLAAEAVEGLEEADGTWWEGWTDAVDDTRRALLDDVYRT